MTFQLKPIQAKNALSSNYGKNIAINPYQGCVFACEFCSAIKMNYFTGRTKEKWDFAGCETRYSVVAKTLEKDERFGELFDSYGWG